MMVAGGDLMRAGREVLPTAVPLPVLDTMAKKRIYNSIKLCGVVGK